jgi:hypothetical protein
MGHQSQGVHLIKIRLTTRLLLRLLAPDDTTLLRHIKWDVSKRHPRLCGLQHAWKSILRAKLNHLRLKRQSQSQTLAHRSRQKNLKPRSSRRRRLWRLFTARELISWYSQLTKIDPTRTKAKLEAMYRFRDAILARIPVDFVDDKSVLMRDICL